MSEKLLIESIEETAQEMTEDEALEWFKELPEELDLIDQALMSSLLKVHPNLKDRIFAYLRGDC